MVSRSILIAMLLIAMLLIATPWIATSAMCGAALAQSREVDYRQVDRELQARNAARLDNGGRVRLELLSPDVIKDARTSPIDVVDGNVHSRQVMTGTPYRIHIDLVDELPVEAIHLICSDYAAEASPREIQVQLADGTVYSKTLEKIPAVRRQAKPRQSIEMGGKRTRWVEVTVLSNHPGGNSQQGTPIKWGGIGEIEVITSANLAPYLTLADFNPELPQDIRSAPSRSDYSNVTVHLPPPIPLDQRPGIYLSAEQWRDLFTTMGHSPRGKPVLEHLIAAARNYLTQSVVYPDPNVPAQMKDRGDAPARAHDGLSKQAGIAAYAYRITGEPRYAQRAREILVGYAERYPDQYQEHKGVSGSDTAKVMAQRLSEAMWLIPLIQSYDLASDAACFTDVDRRLIEEDLIRHAITFINRKRPAAVDVVEKTQRNPNWRTDPAANTNTASLGNWTAFYNMAFIQGGIVLGDQDWIDLGADGLKYMLENGIGLDGMWGEGAIGYQQFARHAMVGGLESLARKGIDLWSYKDCVFKNLFDSEFRYAYPDGTSPGINDSGRAPVGSGWTAMAFDYAYLRYGDPNYAKTVNHTPRQLHHSPACYFPTLIYEPLAEQPVKGQTSLVFDKLGYAIFRGAEQGSATFSLMDYGPHGGVHGHYDKLNLILFADGDELAGEPESYRYEDARHADWTKTTIAHWTLGVDGHSQNPTTGRLVCFADQGPIKIMRAQAAGAYAGVALDRTVVAMAGYVLDVFRGWGPAEHTFDYPLCFRGQLDRQRDVSDERRVPMASVAPGYRHLRAAGPTIVNQPWTGVWQRASSAPNPAAETTDGRRGSPSNRVRATVLPTPGMQAWVADVPGGRHQAILRQTGSDASFTCLIEPYQTADAIAMIEPIETGGPVAATGIKITRADGDVDLVVVRHDPMLDGHPAPATTFAGYATRALVDVRSLDPAGREIARLAVGGTDATDSAAIQPAAFENPPDSSFADTWELVPQVVDTPDWHLWGASPVIDDAGRVNLFVARWPTRVGWQLGWRQHSEIALYRSDQPEGPFSYITTVVQGDGNGWDAVGMHNPCVSQVGDRYALFHIANSWEGGIKQHGPNQRIGLRVADSLEGPWRKVSEDGLALAPDAWCADSACGVNNPAFVQAPDGRFLLYFKAIAGPDRSQGVKMGVASSDKLEGPYRIQPQPVTANNRTIEDGTAFIWGDKICLLTTDNHGIIERGGGLLWVSDDGVHFQRNPVHAFHPLRGYLKNGVPAKARMHYGRETKFERPQMLTRNHRPALLYLPSGTSLDGDAGTDVHLLRQPGRHTPVLLKQDSEAASVADRRTAKRDLRVPRTSSGEPAAGRRVAITPPEYSGSDVHHMLYLPPDWTKSWKARNTSWPVIVEYPGNHYPTSGATGKVEDAALGYGISGGRFIGVTLPFVDADARQNAIRWWGDESATTEYAKRNVPRICEQFGGDPQAVFLCGFSRGAIAANYIGLHDDELAKLWCGLITHDHYDGLDEWKGTHWGAPLDAYRKSATERLGRLGGRPVLICQGAGTGRIADYLRPRISLDEFTFVDVNVREILGTFPNEIASHPHTDQWLVKDSPERRRVWAWVRDVLQRQEGAAAVVTCPNSDL